MDRTACWSQSVFAEDRHRALFRDALTQCRAGDMACPAGNANELRSSI